jgi:2'-5' RNA ligase
MLSLPSEYVPRVLDLNRALISDEELYATEDPTFGRTEDPHVTILYGIREDECLDRIESVIEEVDPQTFKITGFGCFEKDPNFDVVFLSVAGGDLFALNKAMIQEFPDHFNSHGEYHPHLTLAYVKKGLAQEILKRVEGKTFDIDVPMVDFEFSRSDGQTESISLHW